MEQRYCGFCKTPRRIVLRRHIGWTNVLQSLVLASLLSLIFWQAMDPKLIAIYVCLLIIAELFTQVRWRMALPCPNCGFDPIVYLRDPQQAAQRVREFYDKKVKDPDFVFSGSPLVETHKRLVLQDHYRLALARIAEQKKSLSKAKDPAKVAARPAKAIPREATSRRVLSR